MAKFKIIRLNKKKTNDKLTTKFMAENIGVKVTTYRAYEQGVRFPTREKLLKIAELLECTVDELIKEE